MRRRKIEDLEFDNVPFVLNCVDVLAGDDSFVGLRKKRPLHRRLDVIEQQVKKFDKELAQKTQEAEVQASDELMQAQKLFDKEVDTVRNRTEWDERTKEIQLANLQVVAQRRLDVKKQIIEDRKLIEIREGKAESERKIRGIRNNVRVEAALIPPLPPLILGLLVWIGRIRRENLGANPKRLA
jgi:ABC-2 type transport system permease protein